MVLTTVSWKQEKMVISSCLFHWQYSYIPSLEPIFINFYSICELPNIGCHGMVETGEVYSFDLRPG